MDQLAIADSFSSVGLEPHAERPGYFPCVVCKDHYHEHDTRWHLVCPSMTANLPACEEPWVCSPDCAAQWEDDNIDDIIEHYRELAERGVTHE